MGIPENISHKKKVFIQEKKILFYIVFHSSRFCILLLLEHQKNLEKKLERKKGRERIVFYSVQCATNECVTHPEMKIDCNLFFYFKNGNDVTNSTFTCTYYYYFQFNRVFQKKKKVQPVYLYTYLYLNF